MSEYEKTTELQEQQFGFKKFSSTTHAIYTLRETIRVRKLEKKKTYALFLDFSKAFDKVNKSKFLVKLAKVFEPKLWLAICENAKLIIKSNDKSDTIETKTGVKQGGPFSPSGYDEYVDDVIKIIKEEGQVIVLMNNGKSAITGIIVYADDTTILCENEEPY